MSMSMPCAQHHLPLTPSINLKSEKILLAHTHSTHVPAHPEAEANIFRTFGREHIKYSCSCLCVYIQTCLCGWGGRGGGLSNNPLGVENLRLT